MDFITSLDGYGAAEGWPGFWGLQGPEYLAWLGEQPERDYTILMGANTYRLMSGFAAEAETLEADEAAAVDELAATPKVVFSSTLQPPLAWANTQLIGGDAVEAVAGMKRDGAGPMRTLGSLTLCRSLLEAGLVDRFRVVVFPVITGSTGCDRIYDGYPDVALDMVASRTFDGRLQTARVCPDGAYRSTRHAAGFLTVNGRPCAWLRRRLPKRQLRQEKVSDWAATCWVSRRSIRRRSRSLAARARTWGELSQIEGLRVPTGFCVDDGAFQRILADGRGRVPAARRGREPPGRAAALCGRGEARGAIRAWLDQYGMPGSARSTHEAPLLTRIRAAGKDPRRPTW